MAETPVVLDDKGLASMGIHVKVGNTEIKYVTSIPELGAAPSPLDTTVLTDTVTTSRPGVKELKELEYDILYNNKMDNSDFRFLKGLEESGKAQKVEVTLPDKATVSYDAFISVRINSAKVKDLMGATLTTTPQTEPIYKNPAADPA